MIGGGEIVLIAFLIDAPSVFSFMKVKTQENKHKVMSNILLFLCFIYIAIYSVLKTNTNDLITVLWVSGGCIVSSLKISKYLHPGVAVRIVAVQPVKYNGHLLLGIADIGAANGVCRVVIPGEHPGSLIVPEPRQIPAVIKRPG